jgi:hypothetical protein
LARDRPQLTGEDKLAAQQIFRGDSGDRSPCQWCGGLHQRGSWAPPGPGQEQPPGVRWGAACPRVSRLDFHANGNLTGITFWAKWDESGVVFPEDAFDPDSGEVPGG